MKILMLAHETPEDFKIRDDKEKFDAYMGEWYAFSNQLAEDVDIVASAALEKPETATVVSVRNGERFVEDGPYPDTKEQLGGFFLIDVENIDEAAKHAAKCPAAKNGCVDVSIIANH
ncbi:MAG: YciI family protein [Marinicaulis sp.]|nr:YciI family protein [Marinicaulis sp.]NNL88615.1 YciI family protein [Marinicaulis sp.]